MVLRRSPTHHTANTAAECSSQAIGELLVNDYSRRGFIDGRTLRLPTVSIRPGPPNAAASGFASGILREPLAGKPSICPVSAQMPLWLASPTSVTEAIKHGLDLPEQALPPWNAINTRGITVTVGEMLPKRTIPTVDCKTQTEPTAISGLLGYGFHMD